MAETNRILGLDPGTRLTGYGVIDVTAGQEHKPRLVDGGVIRLDETAPLPDRLCELERELDGLIAELRPACVAIEELYAHYNHPKTAIIMAHARGVMLLVARRHGLPIHELSANRVKQSLTGHGHAGKEVMQRAIQATFRLAAPPDPPDVADALAVALCCARSGALNASPSGRGGRAAKRSGRRGQSTSMTGSGSSAP
jgi:crossover junction endodeoxyribonuclease RuvC